MIDASGDTAYFIVSPQKPNEMAFYGENRNDLRYQEIPLENPVEIFPGNNTTVLLVTHAMIILTYQSFTGKKDNGETVFLLLKFLILTFRLLSVVRGDSV